MAVFDVRDFGALGNGIADDTAAFQAAIDAATAAADIDGGRSRVQVPGGEYLIGPLHVPKGLVMWGDGSTTSVLYSRDAGQTTLEVAATEANSGSINIRDLGFWGVGQGGTGLRLAGSGSTVRVHDVRIQDCVFAGFDTGLSLRLASNIWLSGLHASACTTGFRIDTSSDVKATNCFAANGDGWGFWISDDGLHGASGEGVYLTTCTTNVQAGGLLVEQQSWGAAIGCSFTSTDGPAVVLDGHGWRIAAAEIATAGGKHPGIVLADTSEKVVVTGSYFALNSQGIVAGGRDHLIASNIFEAGAAGGRDIVLAGRNILATGNMARTEAEISIEETAAGLGNVIDQNMVWGAILRGGSGGVLTATNHRVDPASGAVEQVQQAPLLIAADRLAAPGERIAAASLFAAGDANGDTLRYTVRDDEAAADSGHWELAGIAQPAGAAIAVTAAQLPGLVFVAGSRADALAVQAGDGVLAPTAWQGLRVAPAGDGPTLRITPAAVVDESRALVVLAVWLDRPADSPVTVAWTLADGSARAADRDMPAGQGGTLTFLPGGPLVQSLAVWINDQADRLEGDEHLRVVLSAPSGAEIAGGTALVTLRDDFAPTDGPPLAMVNTTTGARSTPALVAYDGPVSSLSGSFAYLGDDSVVLAAQAPNLFLRSGGGDDALAARAGQNVLDAGAGSNFLTGGVGADVFFLDARAATAPVWSTVTNLGGGDAVTLWGIGAGFDLAWAADEGAEGWRGLTLHATAAGHPGALLTLTGFSPRDLDDGRLGLAFGHDAASGSDYLHLYGSF